MTTLTEIQRQLAEQLLLSIKNKEPIVYYHEIAVRINPPIHWRHVGKNIGPVSMLCHELGLPLISAKVVNKATNSAGEGFYPFFKMYGIDTSGKTEKELFSEELVKIRTCEEWYKLQDYLGLDLGFKNPHLADQREDAALIEDLAAIPVEQEVGFRVPSPRAKTEPVITDGLKVYPRNRNTAMNALTKANHKCEIDPLHISFIRKTSNLPYMEPHHLIPMANQDDFEFSLDTEANIVCLCPNCHKRIHYGQGVEEMLHTLYHKRSEQLRAAGIGITEEKLITLYK
ncbi:MAG: HNH endonuclease [Oscillospiraceae bacterium]|nr:HNH endonuclease [Oscillospiraceae bacterium]